MTEEKPEADAFEQALPAEPAAQADPVGTPPVEAPEADYAEQHAPALPTGETSRPRMDAEASEADLLEQAEGIPGSDEDYPPGAEEEEYPSAGGDEGAEE
ncbi:hypothetical protein [Sinomonas atrocyanea]